MKDRKVRGRSVGKKKRISWSGREKREENGGESNDQNALDTCIKMS